MLQEAVSTRDLELVQLVLRYRDYQRVVKRLAGIPVLLEKLRKVRASFFASPPWPSNPVSSAGVATLLFILQAQDFYVEMKWEFTSWGKRDCQGPLGSSPAPGLLHLLLPCLEPSSHCAPLAPSHLLVLSSTLTLPEAFPRCLHSVINSFTL